MEGFDHATAVMALPARYRKRLRTKGGVERLNEEIRRRRIFPNEASAQRLIGAVLMEIDEAWMSGHRYFDMTEYREWRRWAASQEVEATLTEAARAVRCELPREIFTPKFGLDPGP